MLFYLGKISARIRGYLIASLAAVAVCLASVEVGFSAIRVCSYNMLHYDSSAFVRDPSFKLVLSTINPDVYVVQEIANTNAVNNVLNNILNAPGGPGDGDPFALATFTDTSDPLDNALFYRASKFTFPAGAGSYVTIAQMSSPRPAYRWRLRPVTDASGANDLYIYSMHLAASVPAQRAEQAQLVRDNANALPAGTHFIFCGDFNLDSTTEDSYQHFTESQADNDGRAWDALNPNGVTQTWHTNSAYAAIHTQCPYLNNPGQPPGSVGGGMDDRFDFLLISASLHDSASPDYVPGTYKAFGNDGLHFNNDINDPPPIPEGFPVADALLACSDHLPVYLDLTEPLSPPQITAPAFVGFPQVLVGATVDTTLNISNPAVPPGIDLQYSFTPPAGFTAPVGSFNLAAGAAAMHTITLMNTSTSGNKNGVLAIANNSTTNPKNVTLVGIVLDHAVPSISSNAIDTIGLLDFGEHDVGMFSDQVATVFNASVPQFPNTVNLAIDSGMISSDTAGRFSLVSFSPPITGISTSANISVHFDDVGATPGDYTALLTFTTLDDTLAVGGTTLSDITFNLFATVPSGGPVRGDFDLDLVVGLEDIDPFVAVLLDPDGATFDELWIADMNEDAMVDGLDLQPFVDAILN